MVARDVQGRQLQPLAVRRGRRHAPGRHAHPCRHPRLRHGWRDGAALRQRTRVLPTGSLQRAAPGPQQHLSGFPSGSGGHQGPAARCPAGAIPAGRREGLPGRRLLRGPHLQQDLSCKAAAVARLIWDGVAAVRRGRQHHQVARRGVAGAQQRRRWVGRAQLRLGRLLGVLLHEIKRRGQPARQLLQAGGGPPGGCRRPTLLLLLLRRRRMRDGMNLPQGAGKGSRRRKGQGLQLSRRSKGQRLQLPCCVAASRRVLLQGAQSLLPQPAAGRLGRQGFAWRLLQLPHLDVAGSRRG